MEENKFNFSESEEAHDKAKLVEEKKENVRKDAKGLFESISDFLSELLDFRHDTDRDATIAAIKADIPFKGATAWILICSIFVASVGLNANSTAVVIGAMLISPLMGPILGVGLSIAVNDIETLKRSLINLATMIVLSLLTAFLFFYFFPVTNDIYDLHELLGRTQPDVRDVLIAFFGGLALIIARTKKGTIASVIFGVAIATALMPPLCTAGYGLAQGNWVFFRGAMYLFIINTIFIAFATFLVLKILRFPMLRYANSKRRRFISRIAYLIALLVMIPAVFTFLNVLKNSRYEMAYKSFLKNEIEANQSLWLQRENMDVDNQTISLYFNGDISEATLNDLENELKGYNKIDNFDLNIISNSNKSSDRILELYDKATIDIEQKDYVIEGLQNQLDSLRRTTTGLTQELATYKSDAQLKAYSDLSKDAKIRFKDLQYFGFAEMLQSSDFIKVDTVKVISVKWNSALSDSLQTIQEKDLNTWLIQKLGSDKVLILRQ
ncbi:DUF389 domain-containing protein [Winogradskyella maritima]|uniref:DUF389 domain-containing protein n=1 Tax=Winogradskyella maritima TaxID=1517766 RepID=A0ABV8ANN4_9FLAO|nr:DUF389 domain-containing protein [Winogradskyella maritima]